MQAQRQDHKPAPVSHQRGLTIMEVLVALSVLALLVALTLPALQSARERSRQLQCADRLRAFGTALHAFAATRQRLPPGAVPSGYTVELASQATARSGPSLPQRVHVIRHSPHVLLLPWLDQATLYDALVQTVDDREPWDPQQDTAPARQPLPAFRCPSDPARRGNNIRVCSGAGPGFHDHREQQVPPQGGAFSDSTGHTFAEFHDGLSTTVAASERIVATRGATRFSAAEHYWFSNVYSLLRRLPSADEMQNVCEISGTPPSSWYPNVGQSWSRPGYDFTWYNHIVAPNSRQADCTVNGLGTQFPAEHSGNHGFSSAGSHKASSYHRGGLNVLMLDGSVRFHSNSVALAVWRALATRAGGEPLSDL